jgi:hypothetical protein
MEFMATVSPWARNVAQLGALRMQVVKAEDAVAAAQDNWPERTRAEQHLKALRRELQAAELETRLAVRRQTQQQYQPAGTRPAANAGQQYAEPVAYFTAERPTVGNVAPAWPPTFAGRAALVADAVAELRRAGAV